VQGTRHRRYAGIQITLHSLLGLLGSGVPTGAMSAQQNIPVFPGDGTTTDGSRTRIANGGAGSINGFCTFHLFFPSINITLIK
jgi:hypothetical protein